MEVSNPRIRSLLRQAERTAGAGKRAAARQLYEEIVAEAPEVAAGWLGLARTTRDPETQQQAYERVLALDPDNADAKAGLAGEESAPDTLPATTPRPALEPQEQEPDGQSADPFDQSRAWLDEATQPREAPGTPATRVERPAGQPPAVPREVVTEQTEPVPAGDLPEVAAGSDETLTCYRHPGRETGLRCYSCDRPICIKCAKRTPVGYRCPQCIREAEGVFYTANVLDYLLAGAVALILGVVAGYIVNFVGFFVIFIGPAAGGLIGRLAFRAARRHHGRLLPYLVAGLVAVGGLLPTLLSLLPYLLAGQFNLGALGFGLLWPLVYVFLATGAAFYQVK